MTSYDLCGFSGQPAIIISPWPQELPSTGHKIPLCLLQCLIFGNLIREKVFLSGRCRVLSGWGWSTGKILLHGSFSWQENSYTRFKKWKSSQKIFKALQSQKLSPSLGYKVILIFFLKLSFCSFVANKNTIHFTPRLKGLLSTEGYCIHF